MKYRVACVSNNDTPQKGRSFDNNEFPHLVEEIRDEEEVFIVNESTGEFWFGEEFFLMVSVKHFTITEK